jgi:uncharacterized protein YbjT (DUF2867 family)
MPHRVLVVGATGHLGRHFIPALRRDCHQVRALVRPDPQDDLRSGRNCLIESLVRQGAENLVLRRPLQAATVALLLSQAITRSKIASLPRSIAADARSAHRTSLRHNAVSERVGVHARRSPEL